MSTCGQTGVKTLTKSCQKVDKKLSISCEQIGIIIRRGPAGNKQNAPLFFCKSSGPSGWYHPELLKSSGPGFIIRAYLQVWTMENENEKYDTSETPTKDFSTTISSWGNLGGTLEELQHSGNPSGPWGTLGEPWETVGEPWGNLGGTRESGIRESFGTAAGAPGSPISFRKVRTLQSA